MLSKRSDLFDYFSKKPAVEREKTKSSYSSVSRVIEEPKESLSPFNRFFPRNRICFKSIFFSQIQVINFIHDLNIFKRLDESQENSMASQKGKTNFNSPQRNSQKREYTSRSRIGLLLLSILTVQWRHYFVISKTENRTKMRYPYNQRYTSSLLFYE